MIAAHTAPVRAVTECHAGAHMHQHTEPVALYMAVGILAAMVIVAAVGRFTTRKAAA